MSVAAEELALATPRREDSMGLRKLELLLLLAIAIGPYLLSAVYVYLYKAPVRELSSVQLGLTHGITHQVTSLALLMYILFRQRRTLKDIGFSFRWLDIPVSLALYVASYLAFYVTYLVSYYVHFFVTGGPLRLWDDASQIMGSRLSIAVIIFICINPWFEELVVRAYTMTEVLAFSNNLWIAGIVSVGVQALYHLYQGVPNVIVLTASFAVFAFYYAKSRRILPVILAHLYMDVLSVAFFFHHH